MSVTNKIKSNQIAFWDNNTQSEFVVEMPLEEHQMLCSYHGGQLRTTGITVGQLKSIIKRLEDLETDFYLLGGPKEKQNG